MQKKLGNTLFGRCIPTLALLVVASCNFDQSTYPGEMLVISRHSEPIRIINCEGLGSAQPSGVIMPRKNGNEFPQSSKSYPRLKTLPKQFVIHWRDESTSEVFKQLIRMPEGIRGSRGRILFTLESDNTWKCDLVSNDDWRKPIVK